MSDATIVHRAASDLDAYAPVLRREVHTVVPGADGTMTCDVVILGSGMGGSTFAHSLAGKDLDVLIVERGDFLPREIQNWTTQSVFGDGRYRNAEHWIDDSGKPFSPGVFYYVGGNTKVFGAMLPRFREADFGAIEHAEGVSPAWPITYAEMEPFYAAAERLYKVHGQRGSDPTEPWRSGEYPFPPLEHDPALHKLHASMRAQGLRPFAMPAAVDYGEGRPCVLCSTCDGYPCMVDAKADAEVSALRPAVGSGRARLMVRTKIDRLVMSSDGTRIEEAHGTRDGMPVRIKANRFVLACGAVNSSALLLRSADRQHAQGIGNSSGLLGRNYMVHNSTFMLAVDPRRVNDVFFQKTLAVNDWYLASKWSGFPLGNVQMLGKIREPMVTGMAPWLPKAVSRYITDHSVDLYLTSEDLPDPQNRVTFNAEQGRIQVRWRPNNLRAHEELVKKTVGMMRKAGYPFVFTKRMGIATNSHQCGTALMGTDPAKSVLDTNCKLHDVDNAWIVDSSWFPSSAAVNPALTIAANAMRVAQGLS
ncbi:GMC family oxidoreductase [Paraburkholderia sp. D15]|uniref:GMC oxidoreductase n=1 Tax=Paraburkholderia sp. D15 TaxID=2880218 RepID=UPI002478371E|nr:GMC family oxidoreductase [Paraburkholderia sp. D15]WGS53847.1 GMC family oxidoreductase [Paraburkholderia sp. D15]WKF60621.1 6'''-hydroxyparomomycin C oxidase [Paraburkholderia busanensis]